MEETPRDRKHSSPIENRFVQLRSCRFPLDRSINTREFSTDEIPRHPLLFPISGSF